MRKTFRWSCVILSVVTVCAWAFLLVGAKQPWKNIAVNETPDAPAETNPGEEPIKKNAALAAKADIASPGEGDRMLDPMMVQQEHQQQ